MVSDDGDGGGDDGGDSGGDNDVDSGCGGDDNDVDSGGDGNDGDDSQVQGCLFVLDGRFGLGQDKVSVTTHILETKETVDTDRHHKSRI